MKVLYYCPWSYLANYAHELSNAIAALGIDVTVICSPNHPTGQGEQYHCLPLLEDEISPNPPPYRILRGIQFARVTIQNYFKLAEVIEEKQFQYVLLGAYAEYFAPIWLPRLNQLVQKGVVFGAVVHDPIRKPIWGPRWWHRWSIASAYSLLREAFVHQAIELDTVRPIPHMRTTAIPHGLFQFDAPTRSKSDIRTSLDLPLDSTVMLAFGHIRDNKNLDLVLQAMVQCPSVYLLVAGQAWSASQRSADFYQELAAVLGVSERCRWQIRFIQDYEIADLFEAADFVLLTYSSSFYSASGVLNTAVNCRKLCLASSGGGPLQTAVQQYGLGVWIDPDNVDSLSSGIRKLIETPPEPDWDRYIQANSWTVSAKSIVDALKVQGNGLTPEPSL